MLSDSLKVLHDTDTNFNCIRPFSSIGNQGLDVLPHHVINASGGKSSELTIQKIGEKLCCFRKDMSASWVEDGKRKREK